MGCAVARVKQRVQNVWDLVLQVSCARRHPNNSRQRSIDTSTTSLRRGNGSHFANHADKQCACKVQWPSNERQHVREVETLWSSTLVVPTPAKRARHCCRTNLLENRFGGCKQRLEFCVPSAHPSRGRIEHVAATLPPSSAACSRSDRYQ